MAHHLAACPRRCRRRPASTAAITCLLSRNHQRNVMKGRSVLKKQQKRWMLSCKCHLRFISCIIFCVIVVTDRHGGCRQLRNIPRNQEIDMFLQVFSIHSPPFVHYEPRWLRIMGRSFLERAEQKLEVCEVFLLLNQWIHSPQQWVFRLVLLVAQILDQSEHCQSATDGAMFKPWKLIEVWWIVDE